MSVASMERTRAHERPMVLSTDRGFQRGDGIFETLSVVGGKPQALDLHLNRFETSAAALAMPKPDRESWHSMVLRAIDENPSDQAQYLKFMVSRGQESVDRPATVDANFGPTAILYIADAASYETARASGISAVFLDSGRDSGAAARAPWLLLGAKTLSYAVNMAIARAAGARGADEAILTTTDGYVLEASSSTVVALIDGVYCTPDASIGILPGTSQVSLFEGLDARGEKTRRGLITQDELRAADGVWLVSSVRMAVPVHTLDGSALPVNPELTVMLNDMLLAREN
ncbi:MAG: 4-amino-4-deoxychorismate lyase [Microbacteriaceae bacterium]|nr:4-amino-4-deoxychorismate lyase [Microbacteriaceae bacterium]